MVSHLCKSWECFGSRNLLKHVGGSEGGREGGREVGRQEVEGKKDL